MQTRGSFGVGQGVSRLARLDCTVACQGLCAAFPVVVYSRGEAVNHHHPIEGSRSLIQQEEPALMLRMYDCWLLQNSKNPKM